MEEGWEEIERSTLPLLCGDGSKCHYERAPRFTHGGLLEGELGGQKYQGLAERAFGDLRQKSRTRLDP